MFEDDVGAFADLELLEAGWLPAPNADHATTPKPGNKTKPKTSRRRPGSDPNWKPRAKGEKIDYASDAYLKAAAAASQGIPFFETLQWMQVQLLDHGESSNRGHVRYALKFEVSEARIDHCTTAGLRATARVRWQQF